MASLTPRGKAMRHMRNHRGITEQPRNSNTDNRPTRLNHEPGKRGIREAQIATAGNSTWLIGTPWCGEWCYWALERAGVKHISYRQASVSIIEADAKAKVGPFSGWVWPSEWRSVLRGDLVVLFGHGIHVEMVRGFKRSNGTVYVITEGGNTSGGNSGSQSNGGGSYKRYRRLSNVRGFAKVDYGRSGPGLMVDLIATRANMKKIDESTANIQPESSDDLLVEILKTVPVPEAQELVEEITSQ